MCHIKDRSVISIKENAVSYTAPVVRRIFQSKISGMRDGAIANELNDEGIISPFAYRYAKGW